MTHALFSSVREPVYAGNGAVLAISFIGGLDGLLKVGQVCLVFSMLVFTLYKIRKVRLETRKLRE